MWDINFIQLGLTEKVWKPLPWTKAAYTDAQLPWMNYWLHFEAAAGVGAAVWLRHRTGGTGLVMVEAKMKEEQPRLSAISQVEAPISNKHLDIQTWIQEQSNSPLKRQKTASTFQWSNQIPAVTINTKGTLFYPAVPHYKGSHFSLSLSVLAGLMFTFQVHSSLKTLSEAAGRAVLPADLIDDAVVSPRTEVVVLACEEERRRGGG